MIKYKYIIDGNNNSNNNNNMAFEEFINYIHKIGEWIFISIFHLLVKSSTNMRFDSIYWKKSFLSWTDDVWFVIIYEIILFLK